MTRVLLMLDAADDGRDGARMAAEDRPPARPPLRAATNCELPPKEESIFMILASIAAKAGSTETMLPANKTAATADMAAFWKP